MSKLRCNFLLLLLLVGLVGPATPSAPSHHNPQHEIALRDTSATAPATLPQAKIGMFRDRTQTLVMPWYSLWFVDNTERGGDGGGGGGGGSGGIGEARGGVGGGDVETQQVHSTVCLSMQRLVLTHLVDAMPGGAALRVHVEK